MVNLLRLRSTFEAAQVLGTQAAARPDDSVFEGLVDQHYRRVYSLIYRMIKSEPDAADLTQEVFFRVYRALPRLRADGAQTAWIRRIATNLCLDYLRRRKTSPPPASLDFNGEDGGSSWEIADSSADPDRIFSVAERTQMLRRAIDTLPLDYRTVILMHHLEDMRVEEMAEILKVPAGTIKSRLSRARRALYRKLAPYFDASL